MTRPASTLPPLSTIERVYVGLGSNLGPRRDLLRSSLDALRELMVVEQVSPLYETAPLGPVEQPPFLNAVLAGSRAPEPQVLLRAMLAIERRLGRRRDGPRFGPRRIDLDLLLYGQRQLDLPADAELPALTLPHPRMHQRGFVLRPLADIAPELLHPRLGLSLSQLAERIGDAGLLRVEGAGWAEADRES